MGESRGGSGSEVIKKNKKNKWKLMNVIVLSLYTNSNYLLNEIIVILIINLIIILLIFIVTILLFLLPTYFRLGGKATGPTIF